MTKTEGRICLLLAGFFLTLYFTTAGGHFYSGDGATLYGATSNIVLKGTTALDSGYGAVGVDGRLYLKSGLGQAIAEIPFFLVGWGVGSLLDNLGPEMSMTAVSFFNVPVSALAAVLVFLVGRALGWSVRRGAGVALVYGAATLAFPYSGYCFNHPLTGLCLLGAVLFSLRYAANRGAWSAAGASCLLGYAAFTRAEYGAVFPIFFVFLFGLRPRKWPRKAAPWLGFFLPFLLFAGGILWYNYARFHDIFQAGYVGERFDFSLGQGLTILLLHPAKSLFLYNPPVILGLPALLFLSRKRPREAALLFSLFLVSLLVHAKWHSVQGGLSWGPRLLLEVIPFVVLPLGALPNGRIWEGIKVFLALAGFLVQLPGALANYKWNELTSELDAGMFTGNIRHILRGEIDSWVFRHLGPVTFAGLLAFSVFLFFRIRRQMRAAGRDRRFCGPLSG